MTPQEMMQMWQQMQGQQQPQQGPDLAGLIQALRAPKQQLHLGMSGAPIAPGSGTTDPFTNGFFKDTNQRIGVESSRLGGGMFGAEGVNAGLAPREVNPLAMAAFPQGQVQAEQPFQQASYAPGTPMEGMINTGLPDAQKYQDGNFWRASGHASFGPPAPGVDFWHSLFSQIKPKANSLGLPTASRFGSI